MLCAARLGTPERMICDGSQCNAARALRTRPRRGEVPEMMASSQQECEFEDRCTIYERWPSIHGEAPAYRVLLIAISANVPVGPEL